MRKILFLFALLVPGIALAAQTQMVRLTRFEGKPIVGVAASGSFNVELIRSDRTYAVVEVNAEYEDILLFELDGRGVVTVGFRTNAPLRFENNLVCRARIYLPHPEFIHGSGAASIACSGGFESNALQIELNGAAKLNGPEIAVTGEVNLQCSGASRMTDAAINCRELNGILNGASKADIREFSGNLFCDISGASLHPHGRQRRDRRHQGQRSFEFRRAATQFAGLPDRSVLGVESKHRNRTGRPDGQRKQRLQHHLQRRPDDPEHHHLFRIVDKKSTLTSQLHN